MDNKKVPNSQVWLKLVITNMLKNRAKKVKMRAPTMRGLETEQLEAITVDHQDLLYDHRSSKPEIWNYGRK